MANKYAFFCISLFFGLCAAAQGVWTQKAYSPTKRSAGISFSIGSKGYVGLGSDSVNLLNDFWEYDPATNVWTQKANYSGSTRVYAAAFTLGTRGYVVSGANANNLINELWEYNPTNNNWSQKAAFPGNARYGGVAFSIGTSGYFGTGYDGTYIYNDFYEYNPTSNAWTQKANVAGSSAGARGFAGGFATGGKGYLGGGWNGNYLSDFYEYNPTGNTWTQKAALGSGPVNGVTAMSIGSKGYFMGGFSSNISNRINDTWEYDPANNTWTQRNSFPSQPRNGAFGFVVNNKGYLGCGNSGNSFALDFFEFDPTILSAWTSLYSSSFVDRRDAFSFSIGKKGYMGTGYDMNNYNFDDFWEYNSDSDVWSQMAAYPGSYTVGATGLSIGSKGYAGTGFSNGNWKNEFYEYDPASNTWAQKANFAGGPRNSAIGFGYASVGYLGTGFDGTSRYNDFWQYNPANNTWTQKSNVGGPVRSGAIAFTLGGKAYVGTGWNGTTFYKDFWEYNPNSDVWVQKANFGGNARYLAVGFAIGNRGYIGTGWDGPQVYDDLWEYNPVTNAWVTRESFTGGPRFDAVALYFPNKACIGTGGNGQTTFSNFFMYNPYQVRINGFTPLNACPGDTISIGYWTAKTSQSLTFQLSNGTGSFTNPVTLATSTSSIGNDSIKIRIPLSLLNGTGYLMRVVSGPDTSNISNPLQVGSVSATLSASVPSFCPGDSTVLTANSGPLFTYKWLNNNSLIPGATGSTFVAKTGGNYRVLLSTSATCRDTSTAVPITQNPKPTANFTINNASQCIAGNNFSFTDVSTVSSGTLSRKWFLGESSGDTASLSVVPKSYLTVNTFQVKLISISNFGCVDSVIKPITTNPTPAIPTFTTTPDTVVCANTNIVLQTSATDTPTWLKNGAATGTGTNMLTVNNDPGTYSLRVTNSAGCSNTSASVNLTFKPVPPKPTISVAGSVLTSSANNGNQWYNLSGVISGQTNQTYNAPGNGSYYTIVTLNGCSSPSSDTIKFTGVGVGSISNPQLTVYPNPSNGTFTIQLQKPGDEKITVRLFDMNSREISKQVFDSGNEIQLQQNHLNNGVYTLQISSGSFQKNLRLIIAR